MTVQNTSKAASLPHLNGLMEHFYISDSLRVSKEALLKNYGLVHIHQSVSNHCIEQEPQCLSNGLLTFDLTLI